MKRKYTNKGKKEKVNTEGGGDMANFTAYLQENKDKIRKIAESNTIRNKAGLPIIPKNDTWRNEKEWDEIYKCLKKKR